MSYSWQDFRVYMADEYPPTHIFGSFPPSAVEDIANGVSKKENILKMIRNQKGVSSQDIEQMLLGERTPLGRLGYQYKKFQIDEQNRAEIDGFHPELGIALEVEKGRGVAGNQIMLDLWKFIVIDEIKYGVIIIPVISREGKEHPFRTTVRKFTPLGDKLDKLGLKGLAVIGY